MRRRRPRRVDPQLAEAIQKVAQDYLRFLATASAGIDEDARSFAARHGAAKAALAHLEVLVKLAGETDEDAALRLTADLDLLAPARAAIAEETEEGEDAEGAGG
jgi:hypothetical protein